MGRTKALVEVAGVPMARRVADALLEGGAVDVRLVGGDADELASLGLPVIPDRFPGEGPLGGVLTALSALFEIIEPNDAGLGDAGLGEARRSHDDLQMEASSFRHDEMNAETGGTIPTWLLIVPCDVPWLDAATVHRMCDATTSAADVDVIVAATDRPQYGCAVWNTSTTDRLEGLFDSGVRSLHGALEQLRVRTVPVAPQALHNVNRPADLSDPHNG